MRCDRSVLQERPNRVVHELHPLPFAGNNHILKFLGRAFANDRGNSSVRDQDLSYRDAA